MNRNFIFLLAVGATIFCTVVSAQERLECVLCYEEDDECATDPTTVTHMKCPKNIKDTCITGITTDGRTVRGCKSQVDDTLEMSEECDDKPRCNDQIYPSDRLKCYQCEGCDEITAAESDKLKVCKNYLEDDECYTYASSEGKTKRGCISDRPTEDPVLTCKDNGCNKDPSYTELKCIECDSKDQPFCGKIEDDNDCKVTSAIGMCKEKIFAGQTDVPVCFTYNDGKGHTLRGCKKESEIPTGYTTCKEEDYCNGKCLDPIKCWTCEKGEDCRTIPGSSNSMERCVGESTCHTCVKSGKVSRGCGSGDSSSVCKPCQFTDGCNDKKIVKCYTCNSEDNPNCYSWEDISDIESQICGSPDEVCYTQYTESNSQTLRGCIKKSNCDSKSDCKVCEEDECNKGPVTIPNGPKCYSCNSDDNPECAKKPEDLKDSQLETCPEDDTCVIGISGKKTVRGCSSKVELTGKPYTCTTDKCNNDVFPSDRLQCYQCDDCIEEPEEKYSEYCQNYDENEKCYVYATADEKVKRGCKSDLKEGESLPLYTSECDEDDNCNDQVAITKLQCIECNSKDDPECGKIKDNQNCKVTGKQHCELIHLLNRPNIPQCYVYNNNGVIERGCNYKNDFMNFLFGEVQQIKENRQSCNDRDNCNDQCMGLVKCIKCDSSKEEDCIGNPEKYEPTECDVGELSCSTCIDTNNIVRRGCGSTGTRSCESCTGDGCNKEKLLRCHKCDSDVDDNCEHFDNGVEPEKEVCKNPDEVCGVTSKGKTVRRGCMTEENCHSESPLNCETCNTDLCNSEDFNDKRLKCYQCKEFNDNCDDQQDERLLNVCENEYTSSCFAFENENGKMVRGCNTDEENLQECLLAGRGVKCLLCNSNGCNDQARTKKPSFECSKCDSKEECWWGQANFETCEIDVPYYLEESCYIKKIDDGKIQRGCTLDMKDGQKCEEDCTPCSTTKCNADNIVVQSCIQCTSDEKDCEGKGETVSPKACDVFMTYDQRGCYIKRDGKKVIRGCSKNLTSEELKQCQDDKDGKHCKLCEGQDCNVGEAPPSSASILTSFSILTLTVIVFIKNIF